MHFYGTPLPPCGGDLGGRGTVGKLAYGRVAGIADVYCRERESLSLGRAIGSWFEARESMVMDYHGTMMVLGGCVPHSVTCVSRQWARDGESEEDIL